MIEGKPERARTLAFLFTDIEGSTRIEQAIGTARYAELRERHRAIVRRAVDAAGGTEHGTAGDSFFVAFPTAGAAITAAAAIQRALGVEAWPPDAPIRVRMGIHAGDATEVGGSLVGLDVNRASRVAGVAHGGQVVVSAAAAELAGPLEDGLAFRDLGAHRLKDLLEPIPLRQLVGDGLPETFPPLDTIDAHPNNLPTQLTTFVGRAREVAEALALLAASRLVTLTGPGGTGKTRLSLEVAAAAADAHPDGVFFAALETVREPALVIPRLAAAAGITDQGTRPARDVLVEWLGTKRVLFVLDNFEQVVDAGPVVADLLRSASGLKVLVTSRAPLRVSGEQEYPVPGLPVPADPTALSGLEQASLTPAERRRDAAAVAGYEAVRLFVARAALVRPGFALTDENAPAVAAITARLHGMPLAIELAAARVRLLPPASILARLDDQLGLLAAGSRDLPDRQQTQRGAIAWSYDLLDEPLRRLLDRLSVFTGGVALDAAEAVCGPASEIGMDVIDGLERLADQSLIRVGDQADHGSGDGGEPRFAMLETIREFATEMLDRRGECEDVRDRHGVWFCGLAERAAPQLAGDDQRAWLERLEVEHDNIRTALDRAVAGGQAAIAIRTAFAMWRFWQKRGHLFEARRRLEAMAAADWSQPEPTLRARLMEALGGICWWQADLARMRVAYAEAVDRWRAIGDRREVANALYNLSFAYSIGGDTSVDPTTTDADGTGWRILEEALALYRELGDERGEANVLWGMGNYRYFHLAPDAGIAQISAALERFARVGDRTMEAWALHMLGSALIRLERYGEAGDRLRHALRHFREAGDAAGMNLLLDDLASLAAGEGDVERAARLWGAARSLTATTGTGLAGFVDEWFEQGVRPNVRKLLGPEALHRLAAEGAAMSLDDAVAYALEDPVVR